MSVKICVLRSGSSGNCTVIWTRKSTVLIDCGNLPPSTLCSELNEIGLEPGKIDGIVISHGHGDHISRHTFKIAGNFSIPLYIHRTTYLAAKKRYEMDLPEHLIRHHDTEDFHVNDIKVKAFETLHRGGHVGKPFGFLLECPEGEKTCRIGYLTDTREVTDKMVGKLKDCDALILEANHDIDIVNGKVLFDRNWKEHLNNDAAADAVVRIKRESKDKNALKHVFIAHISRRNNTPEHARKSMSRRLIKEKIKGIELTITDQVSATPIREII